MYRVLDDPDRMLVRTETLWIGKKIRVNGLGLSPLVTIASVSVTA